MENKACKQNLESRKYKRSFMERVYDFVMDRIVYPIMTWGKVPRD